MKTWIKRISIGLAAVLAIVVVGLAVFLLTFDPNAYKDRLQAWVQDRYHRTLTIDGDIDATLFPRLGLTLQGVSLSEPNSAETFASMDTARIAVAIWPLLSRHVVVDHASFSGVKARVVRDKAGRLNFQDLIGGAVPEGPQGAAGQAGATSPAGGTDTPAGDSGDAPGIDIAGLDIKDGEVQLRDDITGQALAISQFSVSTGRVRADHPFEATLSAHIQGAVPRVDADIAAQGIARLDPGARRYEVRKLDLRAAGQLPGATAKNLTARGDLAYEARTGAMDASGLELVFQGDVGDAAGGTTSMDASLSAQRLRFDPRDQSIQAAKVAVRAKGAMPRGPFEFAADAPALDISPAAASGSPMTARLRLAGDNSVDLRLSTSDLTGTSAHAAIAEAKLSAQIKRSDRTWTVDAASPLTLDLGKRAGAMPALVGDINIAAPELPGGALHIAYTAEARADMARASAELRLDAQLEGGKLTLAADATRLSAKPAVKFSFSADTLDLDKLIPPRTEPARGAPASKEGGAPAGSASASGNAPNDPAAGNASAGKASAGKASAGNASAGNPSAGNPSVGGPSAGNPSAGNPSAGSASASNPSARDASAGSASAASPARGEAAGASAPAPASPSGPPSATEGGIDLSALVGPTAQGTIKAGRLVARGLVMQNVSANVKLAQGKLDVAPLAAALYGGKLAGSASLDAAHGNAMATRFTLDGVAVGPLLADVAKRSALTGVGSVAADLATRGPRVESLRDNLAGTVQLRLRDGAIKGFDAARALRDLKQAVLGGKQDGPADVPADAARETAFSRMDADLTLAAGVATIKRLDVASPVLRVSEGSPATIDLSKGTLNVVANVKIADPPPAYADLRELRGLAVPVHVAGPYDALRYRIDWRAVAGDALSRALQRALGGNGSDKHPNGESRQDTIKDLGRMLRGITGK
jgi:AsmA protein